jgi:hypothetical protein
MGEIRAAYNVLVGNLMERYYLEDPVINRRAILKWITQK